MKRKITTVRVSYPVSMTAKMARTIVAAGTNYWLVRVAPKTKPIKVLRK